MPLFGIFLYFLQYHGGLGTEKIGCKKVLFLGTMQKAFICLCPAKAPFWPQASHTACVRNKTTRKRIAAIGGETMDDVFWILDYLTLHWREAKVDKNSKRQALKQILNNNDNESIPTPRRRWRVRLARGDRAPQRGNLNGHARTTTSIPRWLLAAAPTQLRWRIFRCRYDKQ